MSFSVFESFPITRHSDKTLVQHYSHATRESERLAGKVLDDFAQTAHFKADVLDEDHFE